MADRVDPLHRTSATVGNRVRRISCRASRSVTAAARQSVSSSPSMWTAATPLYAVRSGYLLHEPQLFLLVGQRHELGARYRSHGQDVGIGLRPLDELSQFRHGGRRLEQRARRDFHPAQVANAGDDLHGDERVPAQVEEAVVRADVRDAEEVLPDAGDDGLVRAAGRAGGRAERRCRKGVAIDLSVGGQGQCGQRRDGRGHGVGWQVGSQVVAQLGDGGVGDHIGRQIRAGGPVGAQHGDRVPHVREGGEDVVDLGGFDALAPEFDLMVGSAEILEGAVRELADAVAGAIEARAADRQRIGMELLRGQGRLVEVTERQLRAGQVQLAGQARGNRPQVRVEDERGGVRHRATDRHRVGRARLSAVPPRGAHRRFGRAVEVVQLDAGQQPVKPVLQLDRQCFPAENTCRSDPSASRVASGSSRNRRSIDGTKCSTVTPRSAARRAT